MDWHDFKLWAAIAGGVGVAASLSTAKTWAARLGAIGSGVFFAIVFTEPILHWLELDVEVYEFAVAALLALTGDRIARRVSDFVDNGSLPWGRK